MAVLSSRPKKAKLSELVIQRFFGSFFCFFRVIVGIAAFFLRLLDYPVAPAVLAIVLGPIAEPKLRQSLLFSDGDFMIFLNRPIAGPITVIALILIFLPLFKLIRDKMRQTA